MPAAVSVPRDRSAPRTTLGRTGRGSLVHAALEDLYTRPAAEREYATAAGLVEPAWERLVESNPELAEVVEAERLPRFFDEARDLLSGYYRLEDPTRFDPDSCEERVEVELADGTMLRGFIDRIDIAPGGAMRLVDYKTGRHRAPCSKPRRFFR